MPSRTGLAATVWSLLHELGVPRRATRVASPVEHDTELPLADAPDEHLVEQSAAEPAALNEPAGTTTANAEPAVAAAAEQPAVAASAPAPAVPAADSVAAKVKAPGRLLRRVQTAALWTRDVGLGATGYVLLVVVATAGFAASFIGLHLFGVDRMHYSDHQAWLVPIAIDGADIGLSVTALRAAMKGRSAFLNRVMIFACTAISSWVNYEHIPDWYGRRIASLLPILAVILLEFLLGEARAAHERRLGQQRPRLSLLRWAFDFSGTLAIFRAYVLGIPLPEQMAEAAVTVEAEKPKPKRRRHRAKRKTSTPPPERPVDKEPENDADVIDLAVPARPEWVVEGMNAKDALFGYLDRHGPVGNAATLTRALRKWGYEVGGDYGRTMQNRWKRERGDRQTASGEG